MVVPLCEIFKLFWPDTYTPCNKIPVRKTKTLFHKGGNIGCCGYSLLLCYISCSAFCVHDFIVSVLKKKKKKSHNKQHQAWLLFLLNLHNLFFIFYVMSVHSRVILGACLRDTDDCIFHFDCKSSISFSCWVCCINCTATDSVSSMSESSCADEAFRVRLVHEWVELTMCETLVQCWGFHQQYGQVQCSQSLHRAWTVWLWHSAWWPVPTVDFGGQHLTKVVKHYDLSSCLSKACFFCVCVEVITCIRCLPVCLRFLLPFLSYLFLSQQ